MISVNKLLLKISFIGMFLGTCAQAQVSSLLLKDVLKNIEKKHHVIFNYATREIENIYVSPNESSLSLKEILQEYSEETGLSFEFISDQQITIKSVNYYTIQFVDEAKNTPIPYVRVIDIHELNKQIKYSNKYGKVFYKKETKPNQIQTSHLNYYNKTVSLSKNSNKTIHIPLKKAMFNLEEVFLQVYLSAGILQDSDGNFIIKPKHVAELPGLVRHDVLKSVQNLPQILSKDESIAELSIKGGTNDQNVLLWNGTRIFQASHFFGLISAFNYNLVKEVKLYDNATPARLDGSTSATLEIKTTDKLPEKVQGGLGVSLLSADFYTKIPIGKKSGLFISGRRGINDWLNTPTYEKYSDKAFQNSILNATSSTINNDENGDISGKKGLRFYDVEAHYVLKYNDKNTFKIQGLFLQDDLWYEEARNDNTRRSTLDQNSYVFSGQWKRILSPKTSAVLSYGHSKYDLLAENRTFVHNLFNEQKNTVFNSRANLDFYTKLNTYFQIAYGGSYEYVKVENSTINRLPSFLNFNKEINITNAGYGEVKFSYDKIQMKLGVKGMHFSKLAKTRFEPRFQFSYTPIKAINLLVRGEQKSQYLTQVTDLQNNFLGVEKRRWYLANETQYPLQTSDQLEVSINYKKGSVFSAYGTAFYKKVDGITTLTQGFKNQNQFGNHFGSFTTKGIMLHSNYHKRGKVFWLSYAYAVNNYTFEGLIPPTFRNNVDIRHRLVAGSKIDINSFSLSAGVEYRTGTPYTAINQQNPIIQNGIVNQLNYEGYNQEQLSEYFRLDCSINYNFVLAKNVKADVTLGATNLTNRKNLLNKVFRLDPDDTTQYSEIDIFGLRFTPNIAFRIDY